MSRPDTEAWLDLYVGVPYEGLFMRPAGDNRKDAVGVFDDRRQVVRMWRSLGLTVFQVAEGDF